MTIRINSLPAACAVCALVWTGTLPAQQSGGASGSAGTGPGASGYQSGSQLGQGNPLEGGMLRGTEQQRGEATASPGKAPSGQAGQQAQSGQAGQESPAAQAGQSLARQLPDKYKMSNWIGKQVRGSDGNQIGTVRELVMDDYGIVRFAVIESQLLGSEQGDNLVAVPMGHFRYPLTSEQHLVFEVPSSRIQGAPTFSQSQWPNMGDPEWSSVIITYWTPEEAGGAQGQERSAQSGQTGQSAGAGQPAPSAQAQPGQPGQPRGQGEQTADTGGPGTSSSQTVFDPNRDMVYLSRDATRMFERLDANSDGDIDREEAQAHDRLAQEFEELDTFGNGRITRSEFALFEPAESGGQGGGSGSSQSPQPSRSTSPWSSGEGEAGATGR